jgi:electron transfer flavoprotein beta subunit
MPALQHARPVKIDAAGIVFASVSLPAQRRETKVVKDLSPEEIAKDIVGWIANGA